MLLHVLEGRLRIRVPEVKGSPDEARAVEAQLLSVDGVTHVTANHVTGNVLVLFEVQRTSVEVITEALHGWGYLRDPIPAARAGRLVGNGLGGLVLRATTEVALQQLLVALI